ncbi:MAG: 30S ribosomal protein S6 [Thermodesulfobacteriota bacterium]|nr:30S ribosomal protein S6 [Thermodesulfobacteriota bacterium]
MKGYETVVIVNPDVEDEYVDTVKNKLTKAVEDLKGKMIKLDMWGKKKLAYNIKKCTKGYYFILFFLGTVQLVKEIERILRYDEKILRYMIVISNENLDTIIDNQKEDIKQAPEEQNSEEN